MAEAIRISDDYQIIPDPLNCQLQQRRKAKPKDGDEPKGDSWAFVGYWPNLTQLCDAMVERNLLRGEWRTMPEAVSQIQKLRDDIRHAVLLVLPERPGDPVPGVQKQMTISA